VCAVLDEHLAEYTALADAVDGALAAFAAFEQWACR